MKPLTTGKQPYGRRWQALLMLAASLLVVSIGNTILNLAPPSIRDDLDASSSELQWILDGYMLVFAGLLLVAGSLGDRFGRRRTLFVGLATFGAGSLLAALSPRQTELIASRALMGVGAAAIIARDPLRGHQHLPRARAPQGDCALVRGGGDWASRSARSAAAG
jgi:MFS family permease